jgi:hypothetical protein
MKSIQRRQQFIRYYKQVTGVSDVNMTEVARLAKQMGWNMPRPRDPVELLAKEFSDAARQETRYDKETKKPYRVYHSLLETRGGEQLHLWVDIDEAPRRKIIKSLVKRREQMIGDGLQLTLDAEHWNRTHLDEDPIQIILDLTDDVEWRRNAPDENAGVA